MALSYITTFNITTPITKTISGSSPVPHIESETAAKVVEALFEKGPIYSHGPAGLIAITDAGGKAIEQRALVDAPGAR
jgi:hypothetical protein